MGFIIWIDGNVNDKLLCWYRVLILFIRLSFNIVWNFCVICWCSQVCLWGISVMCIKLYGGVVFVCCVIVFGVLFVSSMILRVCWICCVLLVLICVVVWGLMVVNFVCNVGYLICVVFFDSCLCIVVLVDGSLDSLFCNVWK